MTDYTELVKALRYCEFGWSARTCDNCEYSKTDCQLLLSDAADAIEALQAEVERLKAENPIVETVLVDKMRQQMEETVCHCQVKENAELIAKILDDDVDGKAYEPKRGEIVRCMDCKWSRSCGYISTRSYAEWKDWFCADGEREAQE